MCMWLLLNIINARAPTAALLLFCYRFVPFAQPYFRLNVPGLLSRYIRVRFKLQYDNFRQNVDIASATQNRKIWLTTRQCLPPLVSLQNQNYTNDGVDDQRYKKTHTQHTTSIEHTHISRKKTHEPTSEKKEWIARRTAWKKSAARTTRCSHGKVLSYVEQKEKNTNNNSHYERII